MLKFVTYKLASIRSVTTPIYPIAVVRDDYTNLSGLQTVNDVDDWKQMYDRCMHVLIFNPYKKIK